MANDTSPKTTHDIAQMLLAPAQEVADAEQSADDAEQQSEDTLIEGNDVEQVEANDDADNDPLDEGSIDETSEEGDDEEGTSDDDADDTDNYIDINDDDLIEVKIDGKIEYRSIAEAKKALSGEGAYDKRVKEATELRKQAQAEHSQILERFKQAQSEFQGIVQQLEDGLLAPSVQKPSAQLKQSNPAAYQQQLAAYAEDQERIEEGRRALQNLTQKQQKLIAQQRDEYRKEQADKLAKALPALTSNETAPKMLEDMLATAKAYGFTEQEINSQYDHRYYLMVADLAKYKSARGAVTRKANTVKNLEGQKGKKPRTLRSGASSIKARARAESAKQKQAADSARKSGKVKDVAATLIKPKG